jgi:heat shock protein HtpX
LGLALGAIYGGALAYIVFFAVLWARAGATGVALVTVVPVALALAALSPYRTALRLSGAAHVDPADEPALHAALDRLCALADAPTPRLAVSEDDVPEAFTVGVRPGGSVIVVTRGLLHTLEPQEVEAVLAHELTHVLNRDGAVMTVASFPLFAGSWCLRATQRKPAVWLVLVLFLPYVLAAAALYFVCGALTRNLAKARELVADRGAILAGAPEQLASALQKLTGAVRSSPRRISGASRRSMLSSSSGSTRWSRPTRRCRSVSRSSPRSAARRPGRNRRRSVSTSASRSRSSSPCSSGCSWSSCACSPLLVSYICI